jgi:uncharacterized CHY-type Zn-finger protein
MDPELIVHAMLKMSDEEFKARHLWCGCCRNLVGRRETELYGACPRCGNPRVAREGHPLPADP